MPPTTGSGGGPDPGGVAPNGGTLGRNGIKKEIAPGPRDADQVAMDDTQVMSILVTGGAGYIGSHTVRLLRERGRNVVVVDTMEFGHAAALGDTSLVRADIADRQAVAKVVSDHDVDAVMHFAAYKAAGESMERPGRYFSNNVAGSAARLKRWRSSA